MCHGHISDMWLRYGQLPLVLSHVLEERTVDHPLELLAEILLVGVGLADLINNRGPPLLNGLFVDLQWNGGKRIHSTNGGG